MSTTKQLLRLMQIYFASKRLYLFHLTIIHKMDILALSQQRDSNMTPPAPNNANNYCHSCRHTFLSKSSYQVRLRNVHKMDIPTHHPDPNITPDVNDANSYCRSCQRTYTSKGNYRLHLNRIHKVNVIVPRHNLIQISLQMSTT